MLTLDEITLGDTVPFELSAVVGFDGVPVSDFTGWSAWLTFKATATDADPGVLQKTSAAGGITFAGGVAYATITAAECRSAFRPGVYFFFDFQLRDPSGRIGTPKSGRIRFVQDITTSS